jgi:uncharacterized membrane protein
VNAARQPWAHRFQTAAVGALVIGYAALSHYGASSPDAKGLGAALSIGPIPLCTLLAGKMHGALTPAETAYMRRATQAWCIFYGLLSAAILILFFVVSVRIWSLLVNFAAFGLMILMGLADHAVRRRILPRHPGGGILAVIRRSLIG